jgi:anti-sigma B factor antagonist
VHVIEHIRSDVVILEPRDEITADTEIDLADAVRRQLGAGRVNLVLDLSHVPYIDSCGLGRVVQAYVTAQRLGGGLKLTNVNNRNRHLLTVTRLISVLEVQQPSEYPVGA